MALLLRSSDNRLTNPFVRGRAASAAAAFCAIAAALAGSAAHARPGTEHHSPAGSDLAGRTFATAIADGAVLWTPDPALGLERIRAAGARAFRLFLPWSDVAPPGSQPPKGFDAADPADPHYEWRAADRNIKLIVRHGLEPIVCIQDAPLWAEDQRIAGPRGTRRPDPGALALFAAALAKRYSGHFAGLPRVRYWQIWNEPNLSLFLNPQYAGGKVASPAWYGEMLNGSAAAIHAVQPDAALIGGSLAPVGSFPDAVAPLAFMRDLLCLSGGRLPRPTCARRSEFDIWSHHPYTAAGPGHRAGGTDNVWVADLPAMRRLLRAAVRAHHVVSTHSPRFWVTEFGWDSNPPDPAAVPERLEARWVAEALYRMWRAGVSLVTWYPLRDDPRGKSFVQTGLYFDDGPQYRLNRPKLALAAFRFPFVAYRSGRGVFVWGREPGAARAKVVVEQAVGARRGWERVAVLHSDVSGVFSARLRVPLRGALRARVPGVDAALPFSLKRPPDVTLSSPFGS